MDIFPFAYCAAAPGGTWKSKKLQTKKSLSEVWFQFDTLIVSWLIFTTLQLFLQRHNKVATLFPSCQVLLALDDNRNCETTDQVSCFIHTKHEMFQTGNMFIKRLGARHSKLYFCYWIRLHECVMMDDFSPYLVSILRENLRRLQFLATFPRLFSLFYFT